MPVAPEWTPERHAEERRKHDLKMANARADNAKRQDRERDEMARIRTELGLEGQEIVFMCQRGQ